MPIVTALTLFTLLFVITHRVKHIKAQSIVSTPNKWTYDSPSQWGQLDPEFSACGDGRQQSPINLSSGLLPSRPLLPPNLRFYYDDLHSTLTAVNASHHTTLNNGHSIVIPQLHTLQTQSRLTDASSRTLTFDVASRTCQRISPFSVGQV